MTKITLFVIPGRSLASEASKKARGRESGIGEYKHYTNQMFLKDHNYYTYILADGRNGTTYIGMTNNLAERVPQHKNKEDKTCFTAIYGIDKLVYYEHFQYVDNAIAREKQLKKWNRDWKVKLIEKENPTWRDLYHDLLK